MTSKWPSRGRRRDNTPDSHDFPTRPYDLVKEFVIALVVVFVLSVGLAATFSSPDEKPITMSAWANAEPNDVVLTAVGELAGTTTNATYGPPYNSAAEGQKLGPLPLQKWGGVRLPVDSAGLVVEPLIKRQRQPDADCGAVGLEHGHARPTHHLGNGLRRCHRCARRRRRTCHRGGR